MSVAKKSKSKATDPPIKSPNLFPVVGIGASAGGLDAFKKLLAAIPEDSGVAYVLVQHLDPNHPSMLPELLQKVTRIPVLEAVDDIKVAPDHIYVIPSNKMMVATDGVLLLTTRPGKGKNERHLPIDLFFGSLADVHQAHAIGVVLSGTASDGTAGLKAIKDNGGITFAQDEASAAYDGMPLSAVQAGVVDFILPPDKIPQKILEITGILRNAGDPLDPPKQEEDNYKQIIALLRIRKGTDFTYYKQATIRRRILRRMALIKIDEPATYLKYLRERKPEQDILYQDLLIPVTDFFRDIKTFDNLSQTVFRGIDKNKIAGEPIRVWVAGCSTGEEAFSLAICFKEFLGEKQQRVQIFATDISEPAIIKARTGMYAKSQLGSVSPQRLSDFFVKTNGHYQVKRQIRDMCVFAIHNFIKDPPFGRIDLISCRNVLIYMEPYLQKKALTTFHYSLNPKGFLLLGKSETTSGVPDLFAPAVKNEKLYTRKNVPGRFMHVVSQQSERSLIPVENTPKSEPIRTDFQKTADEILLGKYTPAGVVINEAMDIVHFRGNTGNYLEQSPGKPSHNLLKMARQGLSFELRNILHKAKKNKAAVIKENIPLQMKDNLRNISIEAIPLPNLAEPHYLILLYETPNFKLQTSSSKASGLKKDEKYLRIQQMERELAQTREDMRSITEDQEANNEELQSANEELLSGNEELQSLNEEMETNKEELQSTNEELTVVNHEIISLNEQVTEARDYAEAIIATIHEPLIILDKELRVKSANRAFYKKFHLHPNDIEGMLLFNVGNMDWDIPGLRQLLAGIINKNTPFKDLEIRHTFNTIGEKVLMLYANRIIQKASQEQLILLAIQDVTDVRRLASKILEKEKRDAEEKQELEKAVLKTIEDSNKRYNMMFMQSPFAFAILKGKEMVVQMANDSIKKIWGRGGDIEGKSLFDILPELKNGSVPALLQKVYTTGIPFNAYEFLAPLMRHGKMENVYFNFVYQPYMEADETISGVTIIAHEVTDHINLKSELIIAKEIAEAEKLIAQEAVKSKQQFLSNMSHEIRTPMNAIVGFTNMVMKTNLDESQKEYIDAIKVSGEALTALINDILDLAKGDAGKMIFHHTPFNLPASIAATVLLVESKIKEKNLTWIYDYDDSIPKKLVGDQFRSRQVILNLLSNAVKFTEKGKIEMHVRLLKEDEQTVTIELTVSDTGIGIRPDRLKSIFNNFEQVHEQDSNSVYGGTGLGLAIVKQLVELQGGTVTAKSEFGKGSTFSVVLTFGKESKGEEEKVPVIEQPINNSFLTAEKPVRVLVAEDIALNQLLIKLIVKDFGFEVDIAGNGKIVIDKLKENQYDVILMDLQMPYMNGFEATEYIRNTMKSQIPIIALTADVTTVDVAKCKAVGMNDYIPKPIDEKSLYDKIIKCLKRSDKN